MLNEFVAKNPELGHISDAVSQVPQAEDEEETSEINPYSWVQPVDSRKSSDSTSNPPVSHDRAASTRDLNYMPSSNFVEKVVVHQGDLKVRKGKNEKICHLGEKFSFRIRCARAVGEK